MSRRWSKAWGVVALTALLRTPSAAQADERVQAPHAFPGDMNVLMVVLDDVGPDKMIAFDQVFAPPYAPTPRLDALAAGGISFRNFHVNVVCSVTRAALQTGRYSFRNGMGTVSEAWRLPDSEVLLAELLRTGLPPERAYQCGAFGKWHLGDEDPGHAVANGYNRFYGTLLNVQDHYNWPRIEQDEGSPPNGPLAMTGWNSGVVRADSVQWINAQKGPFFAYVCFNAPHLPWQVPPLGLLSPATRASLAGFSEGQFAVGVAERKLFFRAMLEAIDTEIGHLLDGIDPLKLQNTMIFVLSDNGTEMNVVQAPHDPTHGKPSGYELNIRVPMIVSGPLVSRPIPPGGHECQALVEAVDLWSTIAEITGADENLAFQQAGFSEPYPVIDGVSFLPLIREPGGLGENPWVYSEAFFPSGAYVSPTCLGTQMRAISDGQYKYIKRSQRNVPVTCYPPTYIEEFYRVDVDVEETNNLLLGPLAPGELQILRYLKRELHVLRMGPVTPVPPRPLALDPLPMPAGVQPR